MALEVKRKERETNQSLIYRFGKGMQKSGILIRKRAVRFRKSIESPQTEKKAALRREVMKKQYEKIKKMGKPRR